MGKRTKLREAQRRAAEQALAARLHLHGRTKRRPAFILTCDAFPEDYLARLTPYRAFALRPPEAWRCKLRVRCPELRFLELVAFTFARYSVPRHLETAWLEDIDCPAEPRIDLRRWYIVVAQGGSLFEDGARKYLSRAEIHHFLNPASMTLTAPQALWYAVARVHTSDPAIATRIARSRLRGLPISCPFWTDVARFFARHPVPVPELNDLIDYLHAAREADPHFCIWRRSLPALRERMLEWHRTRQAGQGFCHLRWVGSSIPNALYEIDGVIWRFTQIRSGMRLFEEGQRMRHCVAVYKQACLSGESTIWSLTRQDQNGIRRCLTIEVHPRGLIVQCRGFANRWATDEEVAIIQSWANEHGLLYIDRPL